MPSLTEYTCLSCMVRFPDGEMQRVHYKTDWHRYNLKRKVAELPPITAQVFEEKLKVQSGKDEVALKTNECQRECTICRKTYLSLNAYQTHVKSKKHLEKVETMKREDENFATENCEKTRPKKIGTKVDYEILNDEELEKKIYENSVEIHIDDCLFCTASFGTLEENINHMSSAHGFFFPDIEYLVDVEGLLRYLGEKVGLGNLCLYCNEKGKAFYSLEAVRKHMKDKDHCKLCISHDAYLEYSEFYDYTASYPDYDAANSGEQAGMEVKASEGSLCVDEDLQLCLANGEKLGHRSFRKYFKQNLKPEDQRTSVLIARVSEQYNQTMMSYQNRVQHMMVVREQRKWQERKGKYDLKVSISANNQEHYRLQNPI
eukprot:Sdes_comp23788_c0_seq1m21946